MPSSLTSGSSIIVSVQNTDVDVGLRYGPKSSALPIVPQSVSRGARFSRLRWFATATACQVAGPPVRIRLGRPANGGFYFQAFDGSVALPVAGYNYNSVWTPCMGLFLSRSFNQHGPSFFLRFFVRSESPFLRPDRRAWALTAPSTAAPSNAVGLSAR